MNYHKSTLPNGLRLLVIPIKELESATSLLLVGAGSRYETKKNNGISHFLEHMAFKGTKKRPTARDIANLIDGIGAEFNAFTGKELTGYYIKSQSQHVELCLDVLSDMLTNSLLLQEEIDKEKGVILEEINLYEDTPVRKIGDVFEQLLYGDVPMGWDIAGEKEIIKAITRNDFMEYMSKFYSADNMVLVIAGKVDVENINKLADKYFSGLSQFTFQTREQVLESQKKAQVFIKHKTTEQTHFALGVRTLGLLDASDTDEKQQYALSVLASILGGGMSSRLFHEVRERRGLAYYVRTISENYTDCGYLSSYAGVDPRRVDDAIKVVVEEYHNILDKSSISPEELKKAKEYAKGHFILDLEDTKSVAVFYGTTDLLEKKNDNPNDIIAKIEAVTLEQVQGAAQKYLTTDNLNLALIGNYDDPERFRKLLV